MSEKVIISQSQATEIFKEYRDHPLLCWDLHNTGCEARKIWMYPNRGAILNSYINDSKTESISWSFHVAPLIRVDVNDECRELVFDPVMFDSAQEISDWSARYSSKSEDMHWRLGDAQSYFGDTDFIMESYRENTTNGKLELKHIWYCALSTKHWQKWGINVDNLRTSEKNHF